MTWVTVSEFSILKSAELRLLFIRLPVLVSTLFQAVFKYLVLRPSSGHTSVTLRFLVLCRR